MEFSRKIQHLCSYPWKITRLLHLLSKTNSFLRHLFYFISLSCLGFGMLKALKPRTKSFTPSNMDMFLTSVSATTVSSMSVVEMEVFSDAQLLLITALMFAGGEVFTSTAGLFLKMARKERNKPTSGGNIIFDQIEVSIVAVPPHHSVELEQRKNSSCLKHNSMKFLGFVVLGYLVITQILGVASVLTYVALVGSADSVLRNKGIKASTFAVFTVVSTFANCGFVPTNENMIVFSKNSGLLLILIPQLLLGNTLFPCGLRLVIWSLWRKFNKVEAEYLLKTSGNKLGFPHILPTLPSLFLAATSLFFLLIGFVLFSSLEWNTPGLDGLNTYHKVVAIIFQCANARHAGETVVDLSTISPAILVFFIVMMYLPPYTSFVPIEEEKEEEEKGEDKKRNGVVENIVFSQLSYLVIFVVLICMTERRSLKSDPLNFNVLNIALEVISAYGNVGFSTGYSCDRQLIKDPTCVNKWYGFSGKWSNEGKIILIVVMFFGRLKQFNMNGGRAWKLQ